jgi:hypothetical protein
MQAAGRFAHVLAAVGLFLGVLGDTSLTQADQVPEVGVVVGYTPDSAVLHLNREGASGDIPVQIATVVRAGDQISLPAHTTVTVELADSRRIVTSGPGSWTVPSAPPMGWIAIVFHRFERALNPNDVRIVTAITRSSTGCTGSKAAVISVPALGPQPHLKAGKRGLSLAWTGGCPPYTVKVMSQDRSVAERAGVNDTQLRFDEIEFYPARYSILIQGQKGSRATFSVDAVSDLPVMPQELSSDASYLPTIARALWLAEQDHGNWRLDGIEQLMPLVQQGDSLASYEVRRLLWTQVAQ